MADIKDLIGAIVNKDALSVKGIFEELIAEKIGERMDFLRPLVAESMFDEGKMKCEECGYGMAKEDSNCKKCGCSMNEDYDWDSFIDEEIADLEEGDDALRYRIGINAVNRKPRAGQTNLGNIPVGNLPKSNRPYDDEDRKGQPDRLKGAIKRSLGTHNKVNLPESDDNVKDDAPDTVAKNHPIMQLKKLVDTKGGSFTTAGGKTLNMTHLDAARLLSLHTAAQSSETKQKLANAIHKDPIGTHDRFFPNAKINEADQAMIGGPIKVMPKHNSDHIFTYHGKGGYYGGSRTYVYANPKGDKHERFQVVHQGPDQGGEHGAPRMKVSYHPDVLSAQKHAEKLAGKGAMQVREETELDERNQANKVKKIGYEIRRGHEMVKRGENSIPTTGRDGRQLKRISRANPNEEYELDEVRRLVSPTPKSYNSSLVNKTRTLTPDQIVRKKKEKEHLAAIRAAGGKGFKEESELDERNQANKVKKIGYEIRRGHEMVKKGEDSIPTTGRDGRQLKRISRANPNEEYELDEFSSTYEKPKRVVQRTLKDPAAKRMADIANRKGMSQDDVQNVLFQQGAGRKSLNKVGDMRKEESDLYESMAGYTATSEPTKGGHSAVVKDSKGQTRYAGGSVYSSPEHAVKGAKAYINAGGGEYGSDMERSHHKHVTMMAKEEYELDELSQELLTRAGQGFRAAGRTAASAMAVKKILAARGKSTGVKVPASDETK